MKEVFKCDYCNYIGTKEEIEEHEKVCLKMVGELAAAKVI